MTRVVVDASIAVAWFVDEPQSPSARRLQTSSNDLLAPGFLLAEVGNLLLRHERSGRIPAGHAVSAVEALEYDSSIRFEATDVLIHHALTIAQRVVHPVYDCLYLALARREEAMLATFEDRLAQRAAALAIPLWTPETA